MDTQHLHHQVGGRLNGYTTPPLSGGGHLNGYTTPSSGGGRLNGYTPPLSVRGRLNEYTNSPSSGRGVVSMDTQILHYLVGGRLNIHMNPQ